MALAGLGHLLDPCRPGLSQEVCCKASKHSHGCILTYIFVLRRAARRCASLCPTKVNKTARAVRRTGIRSGTGPAPSTHCPVTGENWWFCLLGTCWRKLIAVKCNTLPHGNYRCCGSNPGVTVLLRLVKGHVQICTRWGSFGHATGHPASVQRAG